MLHIEMRKILFPVMLSAADHASLAHLFHNSINKCLMCFVLPLWRAGSEQHGINSRTDETSGPAAEPGPDLPDMATALAPPGDLQGGNVNKPKKVCRVTCVPVAMHVKAKGAIQHMTSVTNL